MTYFILYVFILCLSIIDYLTNRKNKKNYFFAAIILLLFCTLRYGVGFDYFNYEYIYESLPKYILGTKQEVDNVHGEYLFLRYFMILKAVGLDYIYANMLTVLLINLFFFRFISKFSEFKSFSLVVLYCWFFVYIFSTLRQGIAIGFILGVGFPYFVKGKNIKFILICIFASLFHISAIVCVLFPLISKYRSLLKRFFPYMFIICLVFAFIPNPILHKVSNFFENEFYLEAGMNIFAIINRVLSFSILFFFFKPKTLLDEKIIALYFCGILVYLFLAQSDLIASRIGVYFKVFEIYLYAKLILQIKRKSLPLFLSVISIYLGFMLMNIISAMAVNQNFSNGWVYPYVTIFNSNFI